MFELSCYMNEREIRSDIDLMSFQIEGFNGWLFAPIVTNEVEVAIVVKIMKSMNLIVKKVEALKLGKDDSVDYYIWFYKKGQLKRIK